MFFRRGVFNPTQAFLNGAKSVTYMGKDISRRHCASTRSALLAGFVDPRKFLSTNVSASGSTSVIACALASQVAVMRSMSLSSAVSEDLDLPFMASIMEQFCNAPLSLLRINTSCAVAISGLSMPLLQVLSEEFSPTRTMMFSS